jgi:predicted MFS family arabinose efflux permease
VIVLGALLLALGLAATPYMRSGFGLMLFLGLVAAAGAGAGSFSILIGTTAKRLPADKRAFASGFINAGGSFGQFLYAPLAQALISSIGWVGAMWTIASTALLTIPLGLPFREKTGPATHTAGIGIREQLRISFSDSSYLLLHAGFFTCGFHIAFLINHLPGEVNLCGLPASVSAASIAIIGLANIVGSIGAGWLSQIRRMKMVLVWMYASRAVAVALYLAAPKTPLTFYVFAFVLGLTWLATVPPTAGLVGKLFGTRHLATLFGLVLMTHQIGGFFGAWLGGLAIAANGNYLWMWYADIALAAAAALVNLPIKEAHPRTAAAAA